jgi:leucine-zipper-like transcriptional regulator 1
MPLSAPDNKPHPRSGAKAVRGPGVNSEEIYIFGGYTFRKGEYFKDLWIFDISTLKWSEV